MVYMGCNVFYPVHLHIIKYLSESVFNCLSVRTITANSNDQILDPCVYVPLLVSLPSQRRHENISTRPCWAPGSGNDRDLQVCSLIMRYESEYEHGEKALIRRREGVWWPKLEEFYTNKRMACCQTVCGFSGSSWMCWSMGSGLNLTPLVIFCDRPDTGSVTFLTCAEVEREWNRWRSTAAQREK